MELPKVSLHLIADLIESLAKIEPESIEAQSIEELLRRIQG